MIIIVMFVVKVVVFGGIGLLFSKEERQNVKKYILNR